MKVDLNRPMKEILAQLSQYPVSTRLSLTGTIIVGRDIAHAKLKERIESAKTCRSILRPPHLLRRSGKNSGRLSIWLIRPHHAGRMDSYVDLLQSPRRQYDHAGERQP
ncbi:fumarate hydratase class I [Salmonella enterica subsp. enterica]|uniref:Fumarate hydratase class I n=1 Tax=Salmonella enterica I TaxID=59201 RepID=A0A379WIC1_SALET|nr:fumarate hydratase class I [Salmonella enterica subsp. enterica]